MIFTKIKDGWNDESSEPTLYLDGVNEKAIKEHEVIKLKVTIENESN